MRIDLLADLPQPPQRDDLLVSIDVTCINCDTIMAPSEALEHSLKWQTLSEEVQNFSSEVEEEFFKLIKLRKPLEDLIQSLQSEIQKRICDRFLVIIDDVINGGSSESIKVNGRLASLPCDMCMQVRVYADRIRSICKNINSTVIATRAQELNDLRNQVHAAKEIALALQGRQIDEIQSGSENNGLTSLEVSQSSFSDFSEDESIDYCEDDKKMFYKKCLTLKLQFNSSEPFQQVQVASLYRRAIAENVHRDKWAEFIMEHFTKSMKSARKQSNKEPKIIGFKKIHKRFSPIREEENSERAISPIHSNRQ